MEIIIRKLFALNFKLARAEHEANLFQLPIDQTAVEIDLELLEFVGSDIQTLEDNIYATYSEDQFHDHLDFLTEAFQRYSAIKLKLLKLITPAEPAQPSPGSTKPPVYELSTPRVTPSNLELQNPAGFQPQHPMLIAIAVPAQPLAPGSINPSPVCARSTPRVQSPTLELRSISKLQCPLPELMTLTVPPQPLAPGATKPSAVCAQSTPRVKPPNLELQNISLVQRQLRELTAIAVPAQPLAPGSTNPSPVCAQSTPRVKPPNLELRSTSETHSELPEPAALEIPTQPHAPCCITTSQTRADLIATGPVWSLLPWIFVRAPAKVARSKLKLLSSIHLKHHEVLDAIRLLAPSVPSTPLLQVVTQQAIQEFTDYVNLHHIAAVIYKFLKISSTTCWPEASYDVRQIYYFVYV